MRRDALLSSIVLPLVCACLLASGPAHGQPSSAAPDAPPVKSRIRGRLPAYFAAVVTRKQRDEIYSIQARTQEQIDRLRDQIAELERKRDREVDEVLTKEQLDEVQKKRAAAKQRRRSRRQSSSSTPSATG